MTPSSIDSVLGLGRFLQLDRRSISICALRVSLFLFSMGALSVAGAERPNILFIMTDDHSAQAISAYGSRVNQTPYLDRLGAQGVRLERCFVVNSICTPGKGFTKLNRHAAEPQMLQSTGNPADSSAYPNADESALLSHQTP
jgi:Sulfatase